MVIAVRRLLGTAAAAAAAAQSAWALFLLAGAARRRPPRAASPAEPLRARFLIPAHDEEATIGAALDSLARLDHPPDRWEALVVADHCSDATAAVAERHGARVLARDGGDRGKGAALAWALEQGAADGVDAVVVLDADCTVSPNLLGAVGERMAAGARVVQCDYVVANPGASRTTMLRWVAFRLINTVRCAGRDGWGLSAGLNGTGMAFDADVLRRVGWPARSLVEDREQHLELVCRGIRVGFARDAVVASAMPVSRRAARTQQQRWESGRGMLWRVWAPRLARRAAAARDPRAAGALVDLLTLPLSLHGLLGVLGALAGRRRLAAAALAGEAAFVLGGLRAVRAPAAAYRALAQAPLAAAERLSVIADVVRGRAPDTFVRTERGSGDG